MTTGVLWLLIQEHPERDKGGCTEIGKASAATSKGNDSGSGGGMRSGSGPKCILEGESTGLLTVWMRDVRKEKQSQG